MIGIWGRTKGVSISASIIAGLYGISHIQSLGGNKEDLYLIVIDNSVNPIEYEEIIKRFDHFILKSVLIIGDNQYEDKTIVEGIPFKREIANGDRVRMETLYTNFISEANGNSFESNMSDNASI